MVSDIKTASRREKSIFCTIEKMYRLLEPSCIIRRIHVGTWAHVCVQVCGACVLQRQLDFDSDRDKAILVVAVWSRRGAKQEKRGEKRRGDDAAYMCVCVLVSRCVCVRGGAPFPVT